MRGTWREVSLLRTLMDILNKALEMGICLHRGPAVGEHGVGAPFLGFLGEGKNSLLKELIMRNLRDV